MTCDHALERMLEADPVELRPDGETELARHIAACEHCGAIAATLWAELAGLDRALTEYGESADPDAAAVAALAGVPRSGSTPAPKRSGPRRRGAGRRPRALPPVGSPRTWIPLAAAAALAAVLLIGRSGPPPPAPDAVIDAGPATRVSVTPPPDRGAAVLETANPSITIVWLYEREGS